MQLEDNETPISNSESMYVDTVAEEMPAHPQPPIPGSSGAAQSIASGTVNVTAALTVAIPTINNPTNLTAEDRPLQAVAAPSKSKARPKPKPKKGPASKKSQNTLETPQVDVDGRGIVDGGFVVINDVDAAPAGKSTRSRKGKAKAL